MSGVLLLIQDSEIAEFRGLAIKDESDAPPIMGAEWLSPPSQSRPRASSGESSASETGSLSTVEADGEGKLTYSPKNPQSYGKRTYM